MSTTNEPNPESYRWFSVRGDLAVHNKKVLIFTGAHADDLPEGDAGKVEIAERIRKQYARQYDDSEAAWLAVDVQEWPAPTYDPDLGALP